MRLKNYEENPLQSSSDNMDVDGDGDGDFDDDVESSETESVALLDDPVETEADALINAELLQNKISILRLDTKLIDEAMQRQREKREMGLPSSMESQPDWSQEDMGSQPTHESRIKFIIRHYNKQQRKIRRVKKPISLVTPPTSSSGSQSQKTKPGNGNSASDSGSGSSSGVSALVQKPSDLGGQSDGKPKTIKSILKKYGKKPIKIPSLYYEEEYKIPFEDENYNLLFYIKENPLYDPETRTTSKSLSKIRFLYPKDGKSGSEIWALPSNKGRYAVQKWADCEFPLEVAGAILKGKSTEMKKVKSIQLNRHLTRYNMKRPEDLQHREELHQLFTLQICTEFQAMMKAPDPNPSCEGPINAREELYKIVEAASSSSKNSDIKLNVTCDSLKFQVQVSSMGHYAQICKNLSAIYSNRNGSYPRQDEYKNYFIRVSENTKLDLENKLKAEIVKLSQLDHFSQVSEELKRSFLGEFLVMHRNIEAFYSAEEIKLRLKSGSPPTATTGTPGGKNKRKRNESGTNLFIFNTVPSISDIFKKLEETWKIEKLLEATLSFVPKGTATRVLSQKFLDSLEGVLFHSTLNKGRNFWKLRGDWFQVSDLYVDRVQFAFSALLNSCLLDKNNSFLKIPWPKNPKTGKYHTDEKELNKLFGSREDFIVGDDIEALNFGGVEVFDLLQYAPQQNQGQGNSTHSPIFIYHVKQSFRAGGARVVSCQLMEAANCLYDPLYNDASQDSATRKIYNWALLPKNNRGATPNFIKRHYENNFEGFLSAFRGATFVYGLAHLSEPPEGRSEWTLTTDCDPEMGFHDSDFKTLPAKMETLRLRNAIVAMGFQFKICEIPLED